jgi:1-aminocyclopropane-1-carboxylate deaminase
MYLKLKLLEKSFNASPITPINHPLLQHHNIKLSIKRDDLLHPIISGNKWRKLKYNLNDAINQQADTLISMGGSYSNYLHALAYVGNKLNLNTIGIIRCERPAQLNPTLTDMLEWGMDLRFVSRSDYRTYRTFKKTDDVPGLTPNDYWLPEGGSSQFVLQGVGELVAEINEPYDYLCVACGTGATLAGLISANTDQILGFAALKNADYLPEDIKQLLTQDYCNWQLITDYHFGGFAKINPELVRFIQNFEQNTAIPIEPIYTGKMLYGLFDLISKGYFKSGQRIIALHTGGLQGNRGFGKTWKES